MRTPDELLAEALDLPEDDRAKLAEFLIASLEGTDEGLAPEELERAWLAEATRRAREIDSGVVRAVPATEVFRAAREELAEVRSRRARGA